MSPPRKPVSILNSFAVPSKEILDDTESLKEKISVIVTSILTLVGIDANPIESREHILLSAIIEFFWKRGQSLELSTIIQHIHTPPMNKVGVLDLESYMKFAV